MDPTQYRSAAEALLRRLTKQGDLPSIGALVDLANVVSIRHALPVAVFDRAAIHGGIVVRFARGDERWAELGSSTARDSTTDSLDTVEGHHDDAADAVATALDELEALLREHTAPRSLRRGVLSGTDPALAFD